MLLDYIYILSFTYFYWQSSFRFFIFYLGSNAVWALQAEYTYLFPSQMFAWRGWRNYTESSNADAISTTDILFRLPTNLGWAF